MRDRRIHAERHIHLITPGDHFSPGTGSAIPTVVHGLAAQTPTGMPVPVVLVARGTYADRYPSAQAVEYAPARERRTDRYLDVLAGRLGLPRPGARRVLAAALAPQAHLAPGVVFAHNAPQAVGLVDGSKHLPVLYAHNQLLRTYSRPEAGRTLAGAGGIIAVSESLREQLAAHLPPALQERIRVVRNGVDPEEFRPPPVWERGEVLQVMFVGRMIPDKGPDVLLEALRLLDLPDIHLTLIGGAGFGPDAPLTPFETAIRKWAVELDGRATVRPFTPRAELARTLQGADVVVVPSRWAEPSGLTVLEGMAVGAAVIGSDIAGIPEQMGPAGIRVPPGDPRALADALAALAADEGYLTEVRRRGREHAEQRSWRVARAELAAALADLA